VPISIDFHDLSVKLIYNFDHLMQVKSLGYRTDLIFPAFEGEIIDRGDYLVVRTAANPTFYWGNFLLFDNPPAEGDFYRWQEIFAGEIGKPPQIKHLAFGWDSPQGESGTIQPFHDDGFHVENGVVLTAGQDDLKPKSSTGITIHSLHSEHDWMQSIENQVICREPIFPEESYRIYTQRQTKRYQKMASSGLGAWFGAFTGSQLVGDLGIFCDGDFARYQSVQTHPDFRRRGIAGSLVYHAGLYAFENHDVERLVIVAEADTAAQRLYQSIGFQFKEYQMGAWKAEEN
jgi:ribosomal protein S18 acetylase RimI-like enzyme